jgi:putative ABC transport system ATP-binding protein
MEKTEYPARYAISLRDVHKVYTNKAGMQYVALRGISLDIEKGDFVALMGPSGSGKTTLLDLMGTLDTPTSGRIIIDGIDTSEMNGNKLAELRNSTIGFVFQSYNLISYLSVLDNVTLPSRVKGVATQATIEDSKAMLDEVGLGEKLEKRPNELSGGEQQRVAIVRAFINRPRILLADEPTGNLDSKSAKVVLDILTRMCTENKTTVVLSTHDPEVAGFARHTIHIRDGLLENASGSKSYNYSLRDLMDEKEKQKKRHANDKK